MKIYTKILKISSCGECPRTKGWNERCNLRWKQMHDTTFNEPIPENCPLPDYSDWDKLIEEGGDV